MGISAAAAAFTAGEIHHSLFWWHAHWRVLARKVVMTDVFITRMRSGPSSNECVLGGMWSDSPRSTRSSNDVSYSSAVRYWLFFFFLATLLCCHHRASVLCETLTVAYINLHGGVGCCNLSRLHKRQFVGCEYQLTSTVWFRPFLG